MELTISILLDSLKQFHPLIRGENWELQKIRNVRFLNNNAEELNNNYLYIAESPETVNRFRHKLPKNILIIGPVENIILNDIEINLISLDCQISVSQIFEFVQKTFEDFETWNTNLTKGIIQNDPLQTILDIASAKLNNPIAMFDSTLTMLCMSGDFKNDYSGTIWDFVMESSYVPLNYYTLQEQVEIARRTTEDPSPYVFKPLRSEKHYHLNAPLIINSKPCGSLGMIEINEPFTPGQVAIVSYIKELIEFALKRSTKFIAAGEDSTNYIIRLLNGFIIEEKIVNFHLSKRKWTAHDTYYLINFSYPVSTDSLITSNFLKQIITSFPNALLCTYENFILAILRKADYRVMSKEFQKDLGLFLHRYKMKCGISTEFYNILDIKYYYIQSKYALEEGLLDDSEKIIFNYADYYRSHIIHTLDKGTSLKELCHPKILYLWRSGNPFKQNLIRCLYTYLLYGRNITDTANALFIHRNTLTYRLEKLTEYLETDLNKIDFETLFFMLFSCMLLIDQINLKDTVNHDHPL